MAAYIARWMATGRCKVVQGRRNSVQPSEQSHTEGGSWERRVYRGWSVHYGDWLSSTKFSISTRGLFQACLQSTALVSSVMATAIRRYVQAIAPMATPLELWEIFISGFRRACLWCLSPILRLSKARRGWVIYMGARRLSRKDALLSKVFRYELEDQIVRVAKID